MAKAKEPITITRDEWLKALTDVGIKAARPEDIDQGALSIAEYAEMFGISTDTGGKQLRALVVQGKAKRVMKWRNGSDGRRYLSSAFRLLP
jgi:hypothetical protein